MAARTNKVTDTTFAQEALKLFPAANFTVLGGIIAGWFVHRRANRKMTIEENAGLRKEFIELMDTLQEEVKGLRDENGGLRDEVRSLRFDVRNRDEQIGALRDEVRGLHGVIDGMRRDALQAGISTQRAVVEALPYDLVPPATRDALNKLPGIGE